MSQNSSRWKILSIMNMSYTKSCNANRIGFGPVMAKVSSPYLFKSYYNCKFCITNRSVTLIFATSTGGHKCIKKHLECTNKTWKSLVPAKVLNSEFYLCPCSKRHLQNCLNQKIFLYKLLKVEDMLNQKQNGSHMTTDCPGPVLSGTHSTLCKSTNFCTYNICCCCCCFFFF